MANKQDGTTFLSFNEKISPEMSDYQKPSVSEMEDMKGKDPALRHVWTIWEQIAPQTNAANAAYSDATNRVASFSTVKGFWKYWNHLPQPSMLLDGKKFVRVSGENKSVVDALMLFREGIKPEWEDAQNASGGHFQFQLKANLGGGLIDEYWNNIVLGIIGGAIEPADMITGVRLLDKLNHKKAAFIRIEVWFTNWADTEKVDQLQTSLEKCMQTHLDGTQGERAWGKTDRTSHAPQKK
eukprot:TRINITY_DN3413_c1_g1_i1.p1 TRINITY_DN3413_c1_g1~~TRINITY_DN3413_c1_g1_i1.p1  ORF type:complete len:239 (+),score=61.13 TRINITY_DN3413_c1_g1_i1:116-832(+)